MVANSYAGEDGRRTTDPHVGTKTNRGNPYRNRRFQGVMVGVENGSQVSNQTIVADLDAMIGHDRSTGVDKYVLAEHKRTMFGRTHLNWNRLAAQTQAPARDRAAGNEHWVPTIYGHNGRSRTRPAEYGCGPQAGRHATDL